MAPLSLNERRLGDRRPTPTKGGDAPATPLGQKVGDFVQHTMTHQPTEYFLVFLSHPPSHHCLGFGVLEVFEGVPAPCGWIVGGSHWLSLEKLTHKWHEARSMEVMMLDRDREATLV